LVGDNSSLERVRIEALVEYKALKISGDSIFVHGIEIKNGNSHSIYDFLDVLNNPAQDVEIEDHVWVGIVSIILEVSRGTIVGTKFLVDKRFIEPHVVNAGVPAKIIKKNAY
jgi:acetyltransferase-like isoleucine patch superfamily enzyme